MTLLPGNEPIAATTYDPKEVMMKNLKAHLTPNLWQRYTLLLVTLLILGVSAAYGEQLTSGVTFAQVSFTAHNPPEKYSQYGQISVDYTVLRGVGYLNVERYENGIAVGWIVRNIPVIDGSVLSGFSTIFDLGNAGYRSSLSAYVDFSPAPLENDSSLRQGAPVSYQLGQAEYPLPPPARGTVTLSPMSGPPGTAVTVTVNGFPLNTPIDVTFNGTKVATIAAGSNTTTFVVPQVGAFMYEVRAAGGNPLTFGYASFRVTRPPN